MFWATIAAILLLLGTLPFWFAAAAIRGFIKAALTFAFMFMLGSQHRLLTGTGLDRARNRHYIRHLICLEHPRWDVDLGQVRASVVGGTDWRILHILGRRPEIRGAVQSLSQTQAGPEWGPKFSHPQFRVLGQRAPTIL